MLTIQALGQLRININEQCIDERAWRRHSSRQLMQLLLSKKKYRISRTEAIDWLWPELVPEAANNKLYIAINGLRNLLEPERSARGQSKYIETGSGHIQLLVDRPDVKLDIIEFEKLIANAEAEGDSISTLEQAVTLYQGDLFTGSQVESYWLQRKNELQQKYAQSVIKLSHHYMAQKLYTRAEKFLSFLIAIDPTHEEACRQLMQLCILKGNRFEAMRYYEVLKRNLAELLGVKPDPRTDDLLRQIRSTQHPTVSDDSVPGFPVSILEVDSHRMLHPPRDVPDPGATQVLKMIGQYSISSKQLRPIIGREEIIERLKELIASRVTKNICLYGLHGVGKSVLALHIAYRAQRFFKSGAIRIDMCGVVSADQMLEKIAQALHLPDVSDATLFLENAEILLVVDHAESADAARILIQTIEPFENTALLLTRRSAIQDERTYCQNILVPVLSVSKIKSASAMPDTENSSVALFVQKIKDVNPTILLNPEQIKMIGKIVSELDGIPRAIEVAANLALLMPIDELSQQISRSASFQLSGQDGDEYEGSDFARLAEINCDGLSDDAKAGLARLSIFGHPFSFKAALSLFDSKDDLLRVLADLLDSGLMSRQINNDVNPYQLTHLARRYGYKKLVGQPSIENELRRRHANYVLSQVRRISGDFSAGEPDAAIISLLSIYDDIRQTLDWSVEQDLGIASDLCVDLTGFWIARGLQEQAIWYCNKIMQFSKATKQKIDVKTQRNLHFCLGKLHSVNHSYIESTQHLTHALSMESSHTGADFELRIRSELAESLLKSGHYEEALAHLQELSQALSGKNDALAAQMWLSLGEYHWLQGDRQRVDSCLNQAIDIARWNAPVHILIRALLKKAQVLNCYNRRDHAFHLLEEGRKLTGSYGSLNLKPFLHLQQGEIYLAQGNYDAAQEAFNEAKNYSYEIGNKKCLALAFLGMTKCAAAQEHLDLAFPLLAQTLELTGNNMSPSVKLDAERVNMLLNTITGRHFNVEKSLKEIRILWKCIAPLLRQHFVDSILVVGAALKKSPLLELIGKSLCVAENPLLLSQAERKIFEMVSPDALKHLMDRKPAQAQKMHSSEWCQEFNSLFDELEFQSTI
jgi:DNA-binding SARP family transcriptional activator/predicted ATPase